VTKSNLIHKNIFVQALSFAVSVDAVESFAVFAPVSQTIQGIVLLSPLGRVKAPALEAEALAHLV
jgi:hypothetical protein